MTYAELQTRMIDQSHRKDMTTRAPQFIEDARNAINYRLSLALPALVNPDDTNEVLTANYLIYFYRAMQSLFEFIVEFETAQIYEALYQAQVGAYYTTAPGTTPLTITPECPAP